MTENVVEAEGLVKYFGNGGGRVRALDGVDLEIPEGKVLGVLGPNGSGKTTTVRLLSTLLRPDGGTARVAGYDVRAHPGRVRRRIGMSGQYAAVDENLTGFENLRMVGRLYGLPRRAAASRARELLVSFALDDVADRRSGGYSGGMRRRLDLAAALVVHPPLVVLDEPTTGLDPRARLDMWEMIEQLAADGTSVLLTTQYLDEADRLADAIAVLDRGRVVARGTAAELKSALGGDQLTVTLAVGAPTAAPARLLAALGLAEPEVVGRDIVVRVPDGTRSMAAALRELACAGVEVDDVSLRETSLDDVFLATTGARGSADLAESDPERLAVAS